jgi:hypothetical protein
VHTCRERAPRRKELALSGDLESKDVPPRVASCYAAITAGVLYAIQSGAPPEAYQALMIIAASIALWKGRPMGWR